MGYAYASRREGFVFTKCAECGPLQIMLRKDYDSDHDFNVDILSVLDEHDKEFH